MQQYYNKIADGLANRGRTHPSNNYNLNIPLDSDENSATFHKISPTTNHILLTEYADLSVNMEFRDVVFDSGRN